MIDDNIFTMAGVHMKCKARMMNGDCTVFANFCTKVETESFFVAIWLEIFSRLFDLLRHWSPHKNVPCTNGEYIDGLESLLCFRTTIYIRSTLYIENIYTLYYILKKYKLAPGQIDVVGVKRKYS